MDTTHSTASSAKVQRFDRRVSLAVLVGAVIIVGIVAVHLGPDASGDLRNYHYYTGWALLNKPVGYDIAPAQLQTYIHPVVDALFYRVFKALNAHPRLFTAVWSLPAAIAIWLSFRLALRAFRFVDRGRLPLAVLAAVIGGSGATVLATAGTSMSEAIPDILMLGAVMLVLRADDAGRSGRRMLGGYALAGLLAGAGAVLKLTTAPFLLAIAAAILFLRLLEPSLPRLRAFVAFGAGVAVAALLVGGPWWLAVYRVFGNPTFPFYNGIFHSPYFLDENLFDRRFLPQTGREWLLYPLEWAWRASTRSAELPVRDPRLLLDVLAGLVLVAWGVVQRLRGQTSFGRIGPMVWCGAFALVGYWFWLRTFSILRYAALLELISGVLVLGTLALALGSRWAVPRIAIATMTAVALGAVTISFKLERNPHPGPRVVSLDIPPVPADSIVFLVGVYEASYTAAFEPKSVRYIGMNNNLVHYSRRIGLEDMIAKVVAGSTGPLWTISDQGPPLPPAAERSLEVLGLHSTADCRPVRSSIAPPMTLCRVERMPRS